MRLTEVRCYVLDLVAAEEISIHRNGALEPSIDGYHKAPRRFTEKQMLTAVQDLYRANYIRFAEYGLHGVYKGRAELTRVGQHWLPVVDVKLKEFAELRERHATELAAPEEKRRAELAAFEEANQVLKSDEDNETQASAEQDEAITRATGIRVSHVVGLIDAGHVQPGWLIRRRGAWCEITGVKQTRPGWRDVFVREYVRPMEFAITTAVQVMAPVEGTEQPSFLPEVPKVKRRPDGTWGI